jgi:redox-sensitive bicupin YhaK (pirin superfamily)
MNASETEPVHFVQMWVLPDAEGYAPGYQEGDVGADLAGGGLVTVASGGDDGAIHLNQRDAALHVARIPAGGSVELPDAPHVHLFVAIGDASLEDAGDLAEGDAVRLAGAGARRVTAGASGAEVIVWATA